MTLDFGMPALAAPPAEDTPEPAWLVRLVAFWVPPRADIVPIEKGLLLGLNVWLPEEIACPCFEVAAASRASCFFDLGPLFLGGELGYSHSRCRIVHEPHGIKPSHRILHDKRLKPAML